ncbi:MAG: prolyl oligopeptidase family serine peptidase [Planctomycetota bacterium]
MLRSCRLVLAGVIAQLAVAQEPYRQPPPEIVKILEAPPLPVVTIDPTHEAMLLVVRESLPPVADLAKPMWRLAGLRLDPSTSGPHGPRRFTGLELLQVATGAHIRVELPANASVSLPQWSPDGARFAFTLTTDRRIDLWVGDQRTGKVACVAEQLNAVLGAPFTWWPDSRRLLCRFVPAQRGDPPLPAPAPIGPVIQETAGTTAPVRTYQDLLESPFDEARFEYLATAQLALVDAASGARTDLGSAALTAELDVAPSGKYLLVSHYHRPFSYAVPASLFPEVVEIWDEHGKVVREIASLPLRETIPIEGVPTGPRAFEWQGTAPATLCWVEALDGGEPKNKVAHRDQVMMLTAPFTSAPSEVLKTEHRCVGLDWLSADNLAMFAEYDRDRRWSRTWLADVTQAEKTRRVVWDRSVNDRYGDPGSPLTRITPAGKRVIHVHRGAMFLAGRGATPAGDRPFLDELELSGLTKRRLWRCEGETYESVVDLMQDDGSSVLTQFETRNDPPNYWLRTLADGARRKITEFADPAPELRAIHKELVTYERADGVPLSATLYLPPGVRPGAIEHRLPLIVWAYPLEYNDAGTAGQVSGSPFRFTQISGISHLFLLTQGYAIMDGASMPVVGNPETMNDTFIDQIVASAKAAIDKADAMGVADRSRVGVGGHSYGAFMTANLLAHSDLFRAGVARSGAYNRTLTPFGFQSERRPFWEAREVYMNLSPFTYADKINEPLLLIHGELDNNPGTFPIQSERLFHAMKGLGETARLVMLPCESHGYQARESTMHVLAEMIDWFDRYVKNAKGGASGDSQ